MTPVIRISLAFAGPTTLTSGLIQRALYPTPSLAAGIENRDFSDAMRKSQHTASSNPPPKQMPSIMAIVGLGQANSAPNPELLKSL